MSIPLYIRKDYFRAVILSDKSAHILQFIYSGENVDVFEQDTQVFHLQYILESRTKAEILEFYVTDFSFRGKGYGSVCLNEITDQLAKKNVTFIKAPVEDRVLYQRRRRSGNENTGSVRIISVKTAQFSPLKLV